MNLLSLFTYVLDKNDQLVLPAGWVLWKLSSCSFNDTKPSLNCLTLRPCMVFWAQQQANAAAQRTDAEAEQATTFLWCHRDTFVSSVVLLRQKGHYFMYSTSFLHLPNRRNLQCGKTVRIPLSLFWKLSFTHIVLNTPQNPAGNTAQIA